MVKRKTPIRHKVKTHKREGKRVKSFTRGKGQKPQRPHKVVKRRANTPSWMPWDRTPERRFEFLSIDNIGRGITANHKAVSSLEVLKERAEGKEADKVEEIVSNLREVNIELHYLRDMFGRRRENVVSPSLPPRTNVELDRRTNTDDLKIVSWIPVFNCQKHLRSATGYMTNLKVRAKEEKRYDEASILDNEMRRISLIDKDLRDMVEKIKELKIGETIGT